MLYPLIILLEEKFGVAYLGCIRCNVLLEGLKLEMNNVLVSRKGQITIPISFRRKYGIKQGTTMTVQDSGSSIIIQVLPRFEDLAGIDAGKMSGEKAKKMLDKMRSEDRY